MWGGRHWGAAKRVQVEEVRDVEDEGVLSPRPDRALDGLSFSSATSVAYLGTPSSRHSCALFAELACSTVLQTVSITQRILQVYLEPEPSPIPQITQSVYISVAAPNHYSYGYAAAAGFRLLRRGAVAFFGDSDSAPGPDVDVLGLFALAALACAAAVARCSSSICAQRGLAGI